MTSRLTDERLRRRRLGSGNGELIHERAA
jgi:hypothetical protein